MEAGCPQQQKNYQKMDTNESPLLRRSPQPAVGLSLFFSTLCIIDMFGVFPVMTLPRPIIECGWLGLPIALLVFGIQIYTAILLGRCWIIAENMDPEIISKNRHPYSALVEMSLGKSTSKFVTFLLDVSVLGGGVPNLLVASQNLQLLGLRMSGSAVDISYCYWLLIIGILLSPILWLGSPKDMKWVAVTSVSSVVGVALLTWSSMAIDDNAPASVIVPKPTWESFAIAYGILAFQFDIHPMILTVQVDMKNKGDLGCAIIWSFVVTGGMFVVSTLFAMLKYGTAIRYNILQSLPATGLLYLDVLLVTIQICLSMVAGVSPLFQDIEDKLGVPRDFNWKRCATRCSVMLFMVLISEFVPKFDLIMGLVGGALTGPLMFVFPPILYARYSHLQAQRRTISRHFPQSTPSHHFQKYIRQPPYNPYYKLYYDESGTACLDYSTRYLQDSLFDEQLDSMDFLAGVSEYGSIDIRSCENHSNLPSTSEIAEYSSLSLQGLPRNRNLTIFEWLLIISILVLGVLATGGATFYSVRGAILHAEFTPACFP